MPFNLGIGEAIFVVMIVALWLLPLGALGWAVLTLVRMRATHDELLRRVGALERPRNPT